MLAKKQRLTKTEFDIVFKKGKRIHSPSLQLIYQPSEEFHAAAVVGKKVFKKAVDRNRLRRRLYGVIYRYYKDVSCTGTYILVAKPGLKDVVNNKFTNEIVKLLKQTKV